MGRRKSSEWEGGNWVVLRNEMDLMEQRNSFSSILNTPRSTAVCGLHLVFKPVCALLSLFICQSLGLRHSPCLKLGFSSMTDEVLDDLIPHIPYLYCMMSMYSTSSL